MSVVGETVVNGRGAAVPNDLIWRLSVDQYHEMLRAGILTDDDPVELLEGWLVFKMGKNPPHWVATELSRKALERIVPAGWFVISQEPITTETSEPEPDVAVVRGEPRDYVDRLPGARDLALVIEVSEATLQRDREWKRRIYAAAGIPAYWIVNLRDRVLEVHMEPSGPEYQHGQVYNRTQQVALVVESRETARIPVQDLLP